MTKTQQRRFAVQGHRNTGWHIYSTTSGTIVGRRYLRKQDAQEVAARMNAKIRTTR